MIRFRCKSCNMDMGVDDCHAKQLVKCPNCKIVNIVPEVSTVKHNTIKLAPTTTPIMPCPFCGEKIPENSRKCKFCGEYLVNDASSPPVRSNSLPEMSGWTAQGTSVAHAGVDSYYNESTYRQKDSQQVLYAGFWRRFAAIFIDGLVLLVLSPLLGFVASLFEIDLFEFYLNEDGSLYSYEYSWVILVSCWLYYAIMESSSAQGTLGKMAIGIIVTDEDGNRISFGRATARYLFSLLSRLILCIGYLMVAFTNNKQGLHDMIARTLVIVKPKKNS